MQKKKEFLKNAARRLRKDQTLLEQILWFNIRKKQVLGVQFYRQKVIGSYIVDFYCDRAKLVIEVDGGGHYEKDQEEKDIERDKYLSALGILVLRITNADIHLRKQEVLEEVYRIVDERIHP